MATTGENTGIRGRGRGRGRGIAASQLAHLDDSVGVDLGEVAASPSWKPTLAPSPLLETLLGSVERLTGSSPAGENSVAMLRQAASSSQNRPAARSRTVGTGAGQGSSGSSAGAARVFRARSATAPRDSMAAAGSTTLRASAGPPSRSSKTAVYAPRRWSPAGSGQAVQQPNSGQSGGSASRQSAAKTTAGASALRLVQGQKKSGTAAPAASPNGMQRRVWGSGAKQRSGVEYVQKQPQQRQRQTARTSKQAASQVPKAAQSKGQVQSSPTGDEAAAEAADAPQPRRWYPRRRMQTSEVADVTPETVEIASEAAGDVAAADEASRSQDYPTAVQSEDFVEQEAPLTEAAAETAEPREEEAISPELGAAESEGADMDATAAEITAAALDEAAEEEAAVADGEEIGDDEAALAEQEQNTAEHSPPGEADVARAGTMQVQSWADAEDDEQDEEAAGEEAVDNETAEVEKATGEDAEEAEAVHKENGVDEAGHEPTDALPVAEVEEVHAEANGVSQAVTCQDGAAEEHAEEQQEDEQEEEEYVRGEDEVDSWYQEEGEEEEQKEEDHEEEDHEEDEKAEPVSRAPEKEGAERDEAEAVHKEDESQQEDAEDNVEDVAAQETEVKEEMKAEEAMAEEDAMADEEPEEQDTQAEANADDNAEEDEEPQEEQVEEDAKVEDNAEEEREAKEAETEEEAKAEEDADADEAGNEEEAEEEAKVDEHAEEEAKGEEDAEDAAEGEEEAEEKTQEQAEQDASSEVVAEPAAVDGAPLDEEVTEVGMDGNQNDEQLEADADGEPVERTAKAHMKEKMAHRRCMVEGQHSENVILRFAFETKPEQAGEPFLEQPQQSTAVCNAGEYQLYVGGGSINGSIGKLLKSSQGLQLNGSTAIGLPMQQDYQELHALVLRESLVIGSLASASGLPNGAELLQATRLQACFGLAGVDYDDEDSTYKAATGAVFVDVFEPEARPLHSHNVAMLYVVGPRGEGGVAGPGPLLPKETFLEAVERLAETALNVLQTYNELATSQDLPVIEELRWCLVSGGIFRHSETSKLDVARATLKGMAKADIELLVTFMYDEDVFREANDEALRVSSGQCEMSPQVSASGSESGSPSKNVHMVVPNTHRGEHLPT